MAWDFETDAEYQVLLDWTADFVEKKVAPLDMVLGSAMEYQDPDFIRLVRPLQQEVKDMGLWACHLGPELGGLGFGQLKLALLNEISRANPGLPRWSSAAKRRIPATLKFSRIMVATRSKRNIYNPC